MRKALTGVILALGIVLLPGGCPDIDGDVNLSVLLDQAEENIETNVTNIQTVDVEDIDLPPEADDRDDTIVIREETVVITDVRDDFVVIEEDFLVLGFENLTGRDFFIDYEVDGDFQSVFVLDGETVLLEYECLEEVHLLFEDDYSPRTGEYIESFNLDDLFYFNGEDFFCADLFVISIDEDGVTPFAEPVSVYD